MNTQKFYEDLQQNISFNHTVKMKATSDEVVKEIIRVANKEAHSPFVKRVVDVLSRGVKSKEQFIKKLFDYACYAVKYQQDPQGNEIIFTPMLLIKHGQGDCKKFSTFISSVLMAKGITPILRVCSYGGSDWEHIYVIVPKSEVYEAHTMQYPDYITLDPVNKCQYDKEVNSKFCRNYYLNGNKSKILPMNKLSSMGNVQDTSTMVSGIALSADAILHDMALSKKHLHHGKHARNHCRCHHTNAHMEHVAHHFAMRGEELDESGMGRKRHPLFHHKTAEQKKEAKAHRRERRKKFFKKVLKGGKSIAFAPARAAFLGLIMLGKALEHSPLKINLAKKLAQLYLKHPADLNAEWAKFGGKPDVLHKTILKGSNVQVHGIGQHYELDFENQSAAHGSGMAGIGVVTIAAAATAITAAMPIILGMVKLFKKHKITDPAQDAHVENTMNDIADLATSASSGNTKEIAEKAATLIDDAGNVHPEVANNPIVARGAEQGDNGHEVITNPSSPEAQEQTQEAKENFRKASAKSSDTDASDNAAPDTTNNLPTNTRPAQELQHAGILWQPLAFNTWFKFSFLTSTYTSINPSYIAQISTLIAFTGLALVTTHKLVKRFKNKTQCTN